MYVCVKYNLKFNSIIISDRLIPSIKVNIIKQIFATDVFILFI